MSNTLESKEILLRRPTGPEISRGNTVKAALFNLEQTLRRVEQESIGQLNATRNEAYQEPPQSQETIEAVQPVADDETIARQAVTDALTLIHAEAVNGVN